jgi:hypothetical protein
MQCSTRGSLASLAAPVLVSLVLATSGVASAGDWYVDPVAGSNANAGTTPATAWRSVTFALSALPALGAERVHLLPGIYGASNGEAFPLQPRPDVEIFGERGAAVTVLDGGGASVTLIRMESSVGGNGQPYTSASTVRGLTLRAADSGIVLWSNWAAVSPTLEDLVIEGMSGPALAATTGGFGGAGFVGAALRRVEIVGGTTGVLCLSAGSEMDLTLEDVHVSDVSGIGIDVFAGDMTTLTLQRVAVLRAGLDACRVRTANFGVARLIVQDGLFASCGAGGVSFSGTPTLGSSFQATLVRCTLAHNAGVGLRSLSAPQTFVATQLVDSIVDGNGDDIEENGTVQASGSLIGDGDFTGSSGNFTADPLFVSATTGDFQLAWGSPCIDRGTTAQPAHDLAGRARPIDGDLDTVERVDIGAYEFAPLGLRGTPTLGATLSLALWGQPGAGARVMLSRRPLLVPPYPTPYGELDLERGSLVHFHSGPVGSGPPALVPFTLPANPAWVGLTVSFQAVVQSSAAPLGLALSNAESIVVLP